MVRSLRSLTVAQATLGRVDAGSDSRPDAGTAVAYRETLRAPWWWYPIAIGIASLLAAEFHIAGLRATDWIPFGILVPLSIAIVWSLGHSALEIRGGELRIRGAHVPLKYVTGSIGLDQRTLRLVVGREGDPAAFVSIRPWIGPGVQVWIDDEDDPTPYWVVSSRHPERLVKALHAAA
jgi:hypothetical protein